MHSLLDPAISTAEGGGRRAHRVPFSNSHGAVRAVPPGQRRGVAVETKRPVMSPGATQGRPSSGVSPIGIPAVAANQASQQTRGCTLSAVVVFSGRWRHTLAASWPASRHKRQLLPLVFTVGFPLLFFQPFFAHFLTRFQIPILSSEHRFSSFQNQDKWWFWGYPPICLFREPVEGPLGEVLCRGGGDTLVLRKPGPDGLSCKSKLRIRNREALY